MLHSPQEEQSSKTDVCLYYIYKEDMRMARRPKRQVEEFENSKVVFTPCGFCCTMMEIPKEFLSKGGVWRCKKCGMGMKMKPTKIKVAKNTRKFSFRSRALYGQSSVLS